MKKKLIIAVGCVFAFVGCLIMLFKSPSFRGIAEPLSSTQEHLAARLRSHVAQLAGAIGARSLTTHPGNLEKAAAYIEEQFKEAGLASTRQTFAVSGYRADGLLGTTYATQSTANIIAEIGGSTKPSEIVIVGAHYDSVHDCPAANDNASGVAAMLEIASVLCKESPLRTIRFVAFTNEEPPFFRTSDMGSYRYAKSCKDKGDNIVSMLSLETIGYYSDEPNSQKFPIAALAALYPSKGNFISFIGKVDSSELLNRCGKSFQAAVKFPFEVLAAPEQVSGIDFSDQQSFWRVGYPGIMVTDTAPYRYPHYHTNDDTPDKLNYEHMARVTTGLTQVVRDLAGQR